MNKQQEQTISDIEKSFKTVKELLLKDNINYRKVNANISVIKDRIAEFEVDILDKLIFFDDENGVF